MKLKVLSLFSGIGAFEKALKNINVDYELVNYCELDKYASTAYSAVHNVSEKLNLGDITKIELSTLPKDIDLITHGSPCQSFSLAGRQEGGDKDSGTKSSLMWNTVEIVKQCNPKYVIWENVKNLLSHKHKHNFDAYLQALEQFGYNNYYKVLNAKDCGIPQNRERIFVISIRKDIDHGSFTFPNAMVLEKRLKDFLEDEVEEIHYISKKMYDYFTSTKNRNGLVRAEMFKLLDENSEYCRTITSVNGNRATDNFIAVPKRVIELKRGYKCEVKEEQADTTSIDIIGNYSKSNYNGTPIVGKNGIVPTIRENHGQVTAIVDDNNKVEVNGYRIRRLTPKECWRLMGFDDEDFDKAKAKKISNTQLYKQAGNSIVVNVLMEVFKNLFSKGE